MQIAAQEMIQTLELLSVPLWLPKKERVDHPLVAEFELQGELKLYSWLVILHRPCPEGSPLDHLLRNVFWSIGVDRPQWICVTPSAVMQEKKVYAMQDLITSTHPVFMINFGVNIAEPSPSSSQYLSIPIALEHCLDNPLLKQQVMYELYRFMRLSAS